ncbi:MAG: DUF3846 domain-containing protein [Oscillatoriales cyanobacterium]|uniref:DUF3846 domain-containing protein n=1 Tax=unclassified Microcoleus TaxID=2642155 RepID=UPI001D555AB1|nr:MULTISPECIES: DUF3846 domain-containing protein [unclassified Microcoleus]TAF00875.1 MAG: DUF3846 domain-containing protein [Oscillatoriales cyanobacterium]MCC3459786.1 DUF3846 domain-containing protein [Microcoleus sp. PH2017_11_PCY_U_A]MCC3478219.1 DUF3846 domain-containing protein [Microcoleus sp. PH2017_12_PCY_D_A]TAF21367.1 MAG: DUF3846 domain-containing protein [Oscillatoriales cyanobacterium]TAF39706.1 MAG: DUF3846 domain-containing protein [Oscillatoriales cyanobacterium]
MFYVLINSNGIEVREAKEMLTLKEMQNLVGVENESAYIEVASYKSFSDKSITLICDDEFLLKNQNPTCLTAEGNVIHGQVLVLGTNKSKEDFGLLTLRQTEIVKTEIRLIRGK